MVSVGVTCNSGGITIKRPTNANKILSRNVRVFAESKDYSNNVIVGPQTNVRELSTVGAGLSR
jgi:hypothetical protein